MLYYGEVAAGLRGESSGLEFSGLMERAFIPRNRGHNKNRGFDSINGTPITRTHDQEQVYMTVLVTALSLASQEASQQRQHHVY